MSSAMPRLTASTTASRRTCWRSTAWPTPSASAVSTRKVNDPTSRAKNAREMGHPEGEPMRFVERKLMAQIAVLVFALSLVSSFGVAPQNANGELGSKPEAMAPNGQMAKAHRGRQARPQYGNERSAESPAWDRRRLFAEDHRRSSLPRQERTGAEKDHPAGHLRQGQGFDHRQTTQSGRNGTYSEITNV